MMRIPASSIFSGRPLARGERIAIALLIAVAAGLAAWIAFQKLPSMMARDFTYPWRGARAVASGADPYVVIRPTGPPPADMHFMYPLTAAVAVLPFATVPATLGGVLFVALSAFALAYLITGKGMGRAWLFLSVPFALAIVLAQWSPLLIAGALATPLAWALTCKPTLGVALFAYRPTWRAAVVASAMVALTLVLRPGWIPEWLAAARTVAAHPAPIMKPWGFIPLLALLRWRMPEARLVAFMSVVPQNLYFYDQLPLWLVARSGASAFVMTALSWIAWALTYRECGNAFFCGPEAERWIVLLLYLPATLLVLVDRESLAALRVLIAKARGK